jgi:hypothetical protein
MVLEEQQMKMTILLAAGMLLMISIKNGESVTRRRSFQAIEGSCFVGRSCCTMVAGGLGIGAGTEAVVTVSTGPAVTMWILGSNTDGC